VPPLNPNVLYSEFIGDPSFLSELTTDECLIAYFDDLLNIFYPDITFPSIKEIVRSKWATNPLIQGAYTYVPPGSSIRDIVNVAEPLVIFIYYFSKLEFKNLKISLLLEQDK
jgi:hypothetical protein